MIINGDLNLKNSSVESLGEITEINGDVFLTDSSIISLGKLKIIKGSLSCWDCSNLISLGELNEIKGGIKLWGCKNLKSLNKLNKVGLVLLLRESGINEEYIKKEKPKLFNQCEFRY